MTSPNSRRTTSLDEQTLNIPNASGKLFIISAPSGAGKTTLCNAVLAQFPEIAYSVSTTTRSPRSGEENGKDYFFVSEEAFVSGIHQKKWAEWAKVHDNYYGTSADFINAHIERGEDILLDIDVQGTRQIITQFPDSITIFIMPPSLEALRERMASRGTDSMDVIAKRLKNAEEEMAHKDMYRHVIVNDNLETATAELTNLIKTCRTAG